MPMVTKVGKEKWNIKNKYVHDGGHPSYNKWILSELSKINSKEEVQCFILYLHKQLRNNTDNIPW